nr:MAG TPA: hypothetical protein [Caudoviricetes sp.]
MFLLYPCSFARHPPEKHSLTPLKYKKIFLPNTIFFHTNITS